VADRGLTGVLLVGGASRRFGAPKALARLDGETLAERAWRLLGEVCDERLALGKAGDGLTLPFPLLDDGADVRAPIAGLVAGLRAAAHEASVVVPVDCPLLEPGDLRALAEAGGDAAVPPTGPLPGAYRRSALPVLERNLAAGRLALRDALAELDVRVVDVPPERLANVNTPADLVSIVPLAAEHAEGYRRLVVSVLREFGFTEDAELDADLRDPVGMYVAAWVALADGEVAGSVALEDAEPGEVMLKRMYLRPDLRGRGVGRRLLELALARARREGYARVLLDTTDAMVAARRLYESAGFRRIERTSERQGRCRVYYRLDLR